MFRKFIVFAAFTFLFFFFPVHGQNKLFSIEDVVTGRLSSFKPNDLIYLQWKGQTDTFTFIDGINLMQQAILDNKAQPILSFSDINESLKSRGIKTLEFVPDFKWLDNQRIIFQDVNQYIIFNTKAKKIDWTIKLLEGAENSEVSSDGCAVAFTSGNNIFIAFKDHTTLQVTNESDPGIVSGKFVSRNEFGIEKGTFWSPDGKKLAYYRKDERSVTQYPLLDITQRPAAIKMIRYPMAGMKSEHVCIGVFDIQTQKNVYIENDTLSEKYITSLTWDPSSQRIYAGILNRAQNAFSLNCYEAANGDFSHCLFTEQNERYVEPLHPLSFLKNKPGYFIWQSRRDGFNHLYLYDTSGKLIHQLTKGDWEVTDLAEIDKNSRYVYYISTQTSPLERQIYKTDLQNYKTTRLTTDSGFHSFIGDFRGKYFIDRFSSQNLPNKIQILDAEGEKVSSVLVASNPFKEYKLGKVDISTIKAADNKTDLYYRITYPIDFQKGKKYPVIVYVYGGPHDQLVTNSWYDGIECWQQYMAQRGYASFMIDNRGSSNRGMAFESIIHRNLSNHEMLDQMKGVEFLSKQEWIDTSRIGIHGWSYGGFMTISLMLHFPDVFKVGVAGGPVIDWKYYEVMYGERYMDTPEENPQGYYDADLKNFVSNLKGKLLVIHGGLDSTVVLQQTLTFLQECVNHKVKVDYFVYPTHEHNVRGKDRIHLMDKVSNYFMDYLH